MKVFERLRVHVNFGDDFINPPELGIAEREIKNVPHGRFVLIPATPDTHGHGTHTWAREWQHELEALLKASASASDVARGDR